MSAKMPEYIKFRGATYKRADVVYDQDGNPREWDRRLYEKLINATDKARAVATEEVRTHLADEILELFSRTGQYPHGGQPLWFMAVKTVKSELNHHLGDELTSTLDALDYDENEYIGNLAWEAVDNAFYKEMEAAGLPWPKSRIERPLP